jgi:SpoVK/Ycf46/Vps4 family AAA+-type ATPase
MIGMHNLKTSILDQLLYFLQNLHKNPKKKNYIQNNYTQNNYIQSPPPIPNVQQPGDPYNLYSQNNNLNINNIYDTDEGDFKHTVIYGPPGTGKTEVAKILGKIYSKIGVLRNNYFKKVTRADLVGQFLGHTAIKTRNVINECLGGVLFIDEAYSLGSKDIDIYSKECIDTLCEALSAHKNHLMVIIAGYEKELEENFFNINPGLNSRFIWRFNIDKYSANELMQIFNKKIDEIGWKFNSDDKTKLVFSDDKWFEAKKDYFTNYGRDIENLLLSIKIVHSRRIFGKESHERRNITMEDMNNGFKKFCDNPEVKKREIINNSKKTILSLYS